MPWRDWQPVLNADKTLRETLGGMPGDPQHKIPWQVRLFENPNSWFAMPGAVNLRDHDCIHALLCTSFYPDDEAFTVGWTMGTSNRLGKLRLQLFKLWSRFGYPGQYAWTKQNLAYFDKGFNLGRESKIRDVDRFDWEPHLDRTLAELRDDFGVHWPADGSIGTDHVTRTQRNATPQFVYKVIDAAGTPADLEAALNDLGARGWEAFGSSDGKVMLRKQMG